MSYWTCSIPSDSVRKSQIAKFQLMLEEPTDTPCENASEIIKVKIFSFAVYNYFHYLSLSLVRRRMRARRHPLLPSPSPPKVGRRRQGYLLSAGEQQKRLLMVSISPTPKPPPCLSTGKRGLERSLRLQNPHHV